MKFFSIISILLLFISCNETDENTPSPVKDTTAQVTSPAPVNSFNPYSTVDISPMDMAYYPIDFPKLKMSGNTRTGPYARIIYSRPHLQGRKLFKDVLKYGEPWRLGANEATEIELFRDAVIQNKNVRAGRYVIYCIPQENEWTIIFNSNIDTWGLKTNPARDVASFKLPVKKLNQPLEYFTMAFADNDGRAELVIAWDDFEARLPLKF